MDVAPQEVPMYEVPIGEDGWQVDPHEWEEVPVKTEPEEKPQEEVPDEAAEESAEESEAVVFVFLPPPGCGCVS